MVMSARQIGHRLPILSRWRIHDSQNSRAATGRVGACKFQLPLSVASCSVRGSPRPAVTLTFTWPRTFICYISLPMHMMFARFPVPPFPSLRFGPTFSSPDFSSPAFSVPAVGQVNGNGQKGMLQIDAPRRKFLATPLILRKLYNLRGLFWY